MGFLWEYVYYRIHEISSMSDSEYAALVINYNNIGKQDDAKVLKDRGYSPEQIRSVLGKKDSIRMKSLNVEFDDDNLTTYPWFNYSLMVFQAYEKGVLPYPGSLSQQPAKIMEIISILEQLRIEAQEEARKKAEKDVKQRGRR